MSFDDLGMNFLPLKIIRKSTFVYLRIDLLWIFSRNDQYRRPIWEVDRMSFNAGDALSNACIFHPRASWAWCKIYQQTDKMLFVDRILSRRYAVSLS